MLPSQILGGRSFLPRIDSIFLAGPQRRDGETRPTRLYTQNVSRAVCFRKNERCHPSGGDSEVATQERHPAETDAAAEEIRGVPCRKAMGAFMRAATMTRSDPSMIMWHTDEQKFNNDLKPANRKVAKKALQRLWRTKDLGITPSYRHG